MAEDSAYPKSVQAGIPKLGPKPSGWTTYALGDLLSVVERPIRLNPQEHYQLVTAKRNRGGIVERGRLTGRSIKTKTQFVAKSGDFLISRRQIAHGACGIVPASLDNAVVSNEYATLRPKQGLDINFLKHLTNTIYFQQTCFHSSIGVHVEKLVFNLDHWMTWRLHLPPLPQQRRIAAILDDCDNAITTAEKLLGANRLLKVAIRGALFGGSLRLASHPGEWSPTPLASVLRIRGETSAGDETVYSVSVSRGLVDQVEHLGRSFSAANTDNYNRVCFGDIVYTKSPTGSFPLGVIKQSNIANDVIVSPLYGIYVPQSVSHGRLIDLYFSSPSSAEKYLAPFVHRGAKNTMAISDEGFLAGEIPMPPTQEEIDATGELIEALNNRIGILEDYCGQVRLQKSGLMQKLLTGDWPVPASIDQLLPGGQDIDEAVVAEVQRTGSTG